MMLIMINSVEKILFLFMFMINERNGKKVSSSSSFLCVTKTVSFYGLEVEKLFVDLFQ